MFFSVVLFCACVNVYYGAADGPTDVGVTTLITQTRPRGTHSCLLTAAVKQWPDEQKTRVGDSTLMSKYVRQARVASAAPAAMPWMGAWNICERVKSTHAVKNRINAVMTLSTRFP